MRAHPHLYEINTWPWLAALSREAGRPISLGQVRDAEWDKLRARGVDLLYLMGLWKRSSIGRAVALSTPTLFEPFDRALPGWNAGDVAGSAYSIAAYDVDPHIGTLDELDEVRAKLHARGMQLIVDFIPNHTGFDHPWVRSHPDRYVQADLAEFRRDPARFRAVETESGDIRFIACGRDPYFAPWADVAQLNYASPGARSAMVGELQRLSRHADGARCDMAMLPLAEVFSKTWSDYLHATMPTVEFWTEARLAVPGFVLVAEVYWDLEWRLQQLGFDFTYDKRLYDRLLHSSAADVRGHLMADADYQRRSARFIENHDEERSALAFGPRVRAAATVVATIPGLRFFHQGQFEGWKDRLPVQLGRWLEESPDGELVRFYDRLLSAANDPLFHDGRWCLLDVLSAGDATSADIVAWQWAADADRRLVVVNLGGATAHGLVQISAALPQNASGETFTFDDVLNERQYSWPRTALAGGLYVRLETGAAHVFRVAGGG